MTGKEFKATRREARRRDERWGLKPRIKEASWKVNSAAQWALGTWRMVLGQESDSGKWVKWEREKGNLEFTASQLWEISSSFLPYTGKVFPFPLMLLLVQLLQSYEIRAFAKFHEPAHLVFRQRERYMYFWRWH